MDSSVSFRLGSGADGADDEESFKASKKAVGESQFRSSVKNYFAVSGESDEEEEEQKPRKGSLSFRLPFTAWHDPHNLSFCHVSVLDSFLQCHNPDSEALRRTKASNSGKKNSEIIGFYFFVFLNPSFD